MEIEISKYLSEDEIKEIVVQEVKDHVKNLLGKMPNNFIAQLARSISANTIQELVPNFEEQLNTHIKEQIEKFTLQNLFWESMGWRSNGNKLLNRLLAQNESLIEAKIKQIFT